MTVLAILVVVIFIIWAIYKNKQFKRIANGQREKEKQKQIKKEEEKEEEDKKYDKIINCPYCKGTSEVYLRMTVYESKEIRYNDGSFGIEPGRRELSIITKKEYEDYLYGEKRAEGDGWWEGVRDEKCPYCKGDGIAFAWFGKSETKTELCPKCQGIGKITNRVKLEIGMGDVQIICESCNGIGKINVPEKDIVHVKTIARLKKVGQQFDSYGEDEPALLDDLITDENRQFYAKSKPRFVVSIIPDEKDHIGRMKQSEVACSKCKREVSSECIIDFNEKKYCKDCYSQESNKICKECNSNYSIATCVKCSKQLCIKCKRILNGNILCPECLMLIK